MTADSFLLSGNQFRNLLTSCGVDLSNSKDFKIAEIGQGSGTILKTLGAGLDTTETPFLTGPGIMYKI